MGFNDFQCFTILLCGSTQGTAVLRTVLGVLGESTALLFTNAAYDPGARDHLWSKVYRDRLGFRRVDGLRVSVDADEEIPMITRLDALAARLPQV